MSIDTVIFDLNNVAENYQAFLEVFQAQQSRLVCEMVGLVPDLAAGAFQHYLNTLAELTASLPLHHYPDFWRVAAERTLSRQLTKWEVAALYKVYLDFYSENIGCYPDFKPAINSVRQHAIRKVGVLANGQSERVERFLETHELKNRLDAVITSGATPFRKPDREIFELALFALQGLPIKSVMIGDRVDTDIEGGNRAGLWTVRLRRGVAAEEETSEKLQTADFDIYSLAELANLPIFDVDELSSAVIMCGGEGKRMGDLYRKKQKCLLTVHGVPLLGHVIQRLYWLGIRSFHFILGYRGDDVRAYVKSYHSDIDAKFYSPQAKSTGSAIKGVIRQLPDRFLYIHGDIYVPRHIISAVIKKYLVTERTVFATTSRDIAPTHPGFIIKGQRIINVKRNFSDGRSGCWRFSIGVCATGRAEVLSVLPEITGGEMTFEELFANVTELLAFEDFASSWFHLQDQRDLTQAAVKEAWPDD